MVHGCLFRKLLQAVLHERLEIHLLLSFCDRLFLTIDSLLPSLFDIDRTPPLRPAFSLWRATPRTLKSRAPFPLVMLAVLGRSARPVAALRGRAKEGLLSRRRRSNLSRRIGALERVASGVSIALASEVFIIVGVGVIAFVGEGGSRLAGVEINHRIKGKAIGIVLVDGGSDEPVLKEMKIILNGCISCE